MSNSLKKDSKKRLSGLDAKRDRSSHLDPKHSRLVKRMRFALPAGILLIFAVLLTWPQMDNSFEPLPADQTQPDIVQKSPFKGQNTMLEPRFESQDKNKQPYVITADVAEQARSDESLVFLTNPTGIVTLKSNTEINIDSSTGVYHQKKGYLQLQGDVEIVHSDGYILRTQSLFINITNASANTNNPVAITGPMGDIEAPAMKISPDGMHVYFKGPAKTVLRNVENGVL